MNLFTTPLILSLGLLPLIGGGRDRRNLRQTLLWRMMPPERRRTLLGLVEPPRDGEHTPVRRMFRQPRWNQRECEIALRADDEAVRCGEPRTVNKLDPHGRRSAAAPSSPTGEVLRTHAIRRLAAGSESGPADKPC